MGHVFSPSGLPKVAKNCQESQKSILLLSGAKNSASTSIFPISIINFAAFGLPISNTKETNWKHRSFGHKPLQ